MNIPSLFCAVTLILVTASSGAESFSAAIKKLPAETGASSFATGWIPLGLKAADMQEKQVAPGHITDVGEAQLQFHFPAGWRPQDKRPALCIFPGGGYILMAIDKELGVDPGKIGVMGFSAGGHLASMAATLWNKALPEEADNPLNSVSSRPDFAMLIYPVVTMDPKETHQGTRRKIMGAKPDPALEELCSAERQVTPNTPPVFLVHAQDDGVASANSKFMEKACRDKGVSVTLRLYSRGGHGYGMEKRGNPTDQWPEDAEKWLSEREILPAAAQRRGTENAAAADSSGKREE